MVPLEQALKMARLASQAGRFEEAEHVYRQILRAVPNEAFVWNELGLVLFSRRQTGDAAQALRRAVELNPGDPAYHSNLGVALRDLGDRGQAEQCYRRALSLFGCVSFLEILFGLVLFWWFGV
jgi:Flp pilus assembly protein TadD